MKCAATTISGNDAAIKIVPIVFNPLDEFTNRSIVAAPIPKPERAESIPKPPDMQTPATHRCFVLEVFSTGVTVVRDGVFVCEIAPAFISSPCAGANAGTNRDYET